MVRVKNQNDFMERMVGSEDGMMSQKVNLKPEVIHAIDGAFVIKFTGSMNESTANRLKHVCSRFGTNDNPTDIYLGFPVEGSETPRLIKVGSIKFTLKAYKELLSTFSQYTQNTEYLLYNNGQFTEFNSDILISTIEFREPNRKEIII